MVTLVLRVDLVVAREMEIDLSLAVEERADAQTPAPGY